MLTLTHFNPTIVRMWIQCILTVALSVFATSCRQAATESDEIRSYGLSSASPASIKDVFSDVEVLELQYDGQHYPSSVARVTPISGKILIYDNKCNLYVFNEDGVLFSSSVDKRGEGPGEYSTIMGYSWNPFSEAIEILTPQGLMIYDPAFNFIKKTPLPFEKDTDSPRGLYFQDIFDLSENLHILTPTHISPNPYRYLVYDSDKQIVEEEISFKNDVMEGVHMQSDAFFRMPEGKILCRPMAFTPYLYELDSTQGIKLKKVAKFDLGSDGLTQEIIDAHNTNPRELSEYLRTCDKKIPLRIIPAADRMMITLKEGPSLRSMASMITDRNDGSTVLLPFFEDGKYVFPLIEYIRQDTAYAVMECETLLENPALLLEDEDRIAELKNHDGESLILLKYKLKE